MKCSVTDEAMDKSISEQTQTEQKRHTLKKDTNDISGDRSMKRRNNRSDVDPLTFTGSVTHDLFILRRGYRNKGFSF